MNKYIKSNCLAEVKVSYKTKVKPSERPQITAAKDAYEVLKNTYDNDSIEHVECFVMLLLNRSNRVLGWTKVSQGGVSDSMVDPKVVFQIALAGNASSIILSHNHPSGSLQESKSDIAVTKKLKECGNLLGIAVLDHIIVTVDGYNSLADKGLI